MIKPIGSLNYNIQGKSMSFGNAEAEKEKFVNDGLLLLKERECNPATTSMRIGVDKFQNAISVYPIKGLKGSRNANFYEFLTMGMVPYSIGSLTLMAIFNSASKFFQPDEAKKASKLGRSMALGVIFYGIAKNISKKLIELPIKSKYGVDVNLPYKKIVNELPESVNDKDLISYEYHKAFESVDFPRWDLLYDSKYYGDGKNSYYDHVAKKMGLGTNLTDSDQIVKPKIKELITKSRTFTTVSSYFWAAVGVGIAMQDPWERLGNLKSDLPFKYRLRHPFVNFDPMKNISSFASAFLDSCKEFVQGGPLKNKAAGIAGKALLFSAIGVTLLGNIATLVDFKKRKSDKAAAAPIIDDAKAKVVC